MLGFTRGDAADLLDRLDLRARMTDIEPLRVACDHTLDFVFGVIALYRAAMLMPGLRRGTEQYFVTFMPRAQAPVGVFPVERVVRLRLVRVAAQQARLKQ